MFEVMCHSEERSDEESLSYFNRPFVSLRVTDEMREILRYAQNDFSNWLFIPTNYNLSSFLIVHLSEQNGKYYFIFKNLL